MRQTHASPEFVAAAVEILDEHGLPGLTTRSLGERLGVHQTTVYRHFGDWDSLLMAVADELLGRIAAASMPAIMAASTPREALTQLAMSMRNGVLEKPELARLLTSLVQAETPVPTPNADGIAVAITELLRAMGLSGDDLVLAYQAYESSLVGGTLFDFAGAPRHLANRQVRRRTIPVAEWVMPAATEAGIAEVNERAFRFSLEALLDAIERLADAS